MISLIGTTGIKQGTAAIVRYDSGRASVQLLLPDSYPCFTAVQDYDATALLRDYDLIQHGNGYTKTTVFRLFLAENERKRSAISRGTRSPFYDIVHI